MKWPWVTRRRFDDMRRASEQNTALERARRDAMVSILERQLEAAHLERREAQEKLIRALHGLPVVDRDPRAVKSQSPEQTEREAPSAAALAFADMPEAEINKALIAEAHNKGMRRWSSVMRYVETRKSELWQQKNATVPTSAPDPQAEEERKEAARSMEEAARQGREAAVTSL